MQIKQVFSTYDKNKNVDHKYFTFCLNCSTKLSLKMRDGKQRPVCPHCGFAQFQNPVPGVVVVNEKDGQVL